MVHSGAIGPDDHPTPFTFWDVEAWAQNGIRRSPPSRECFQSKEQPSFWILQTVLNLFFFDQNRAIGFL